MAEISYLRLPSDNLWGKVFKMKKTNQASSKLWGYEVPQLKTGQKITINSSDYSSIHFKTPLENASLYRNEDDLLIKVDNGELRIKDFYNMPEEELPSLSFPDNEEMSVQALLSENFQVEGQTKTDPSADGSSSDGSCIIIGSGTHYESNSGELIKGIDRLGDLDPFYWGRGRDHDDIHEFPKNTGLSIEAIERNILSNIKIAFSGIVKEDGKPLKNIHGPDMNPEYLQLDFDLSNFPPDLSIQSYTLTGLTKGKLYLGNPLDGGTSLKASSSGVFKFSPADYEKGIFFSPDNYSDGLVPFKLDLDVSFSSGNRYKLENAFEIIVQPVADKPDVDTAEISGLVFSETDNTAKGFYADGNTKKGFYYVDQSFDDGGQEGMAFIKLTTTFRDLDGSERQFILVENLDQGNLYPILSPNEREAFENAYDPNGLLCSKKYYKVEVTKLIQDFINSSDCQDALESGATSFTHIGITAFFENGKITTINFSKSLMLPVASDFNPSTQDIEIKVGAMTEETGVNKVPPQKDEKYSFDFADSEKAQTLVDPVNSHLLIEGGWAFEGNKYPEEYSSVPNGYHSNSTDITSKKGAPINLSLQGPITGSDEFLDRITFTLSDEDQEKFDIIYGKYVLVPQDGEVEILLAWGKIKSLENMIFLRPKRGLFSDEDLELSYAVRIANESGSVSKFTGKLKIGLDAVADAPDLAIFKPDYGDFQAAKPGTFILKTELSFPDQDGSEDHFVLVEKNSEMPIKSIQVGDLLYKINGTNYELFNNNVLEESGTIGSNNSIKVTGNYYQILTPETNTLHKVEITLETSAQTDTEYTIKVGGRAIEKANTDREYETLNNEADALKEIKFTANPAEAPSLTTKAGFEDGQKEQYLGKTGTPEYGNISFTGKETNGVFELISSATLSFDGFLKEVDGVKWLFKEISDTEIPIGRLSSSTASIEYEDNGLGKIEIKITPNTIGKDLSLDFIPAKDSSREFEFDYDVVTKDPRSGHSTSSQGNDKVEINPVADKPKADASGSETKYNNDQTAAKVGEAALVKGVKLEFSDYEDGSESHYLVVANTSLGANAIQIKLNESQIIKIIGQGPDGEYTQVIKVNGPDDITIKLTGPEGQDIPIDKTQFSTDYLKDIFTPSKTGTSSDLTGYKLPIANELLQISEGKVEAEFSINSNINVTTDKDLQFKLGAYSMDDVKDSSGEEYQYSFTETKAGLRIGAVESSLKLSLLSNKTFENYTPNAHKGKTVDPGSNVTFQLSGLKAGEAAHASLKFFAPNPINPSGPNINDFTPARGKENSPMRLEMVDKSGNPVLGPDGIALSYEIRESGGEWLAGTGTGASWIPGIDLKGTSSDYFFTFKPGYNYSSYDLKVIYNIDVKDNASGAMKSWTNDTKVGSGDKNTSYSQDKLNIIVDAVAQRPEDVSADISGKAIDGANYYEEAIAGDDAHISISASFEDFGESSSELHYVYIEAKPGWGAPKDIVITGKDGTSDAGKSLGFSKVEYTGGEGIFYKILIPNDVFRSIADDGAITVGFTMKSPKTGGSTHETFKYGAGAFENIVDSQGFKNRLDKEITENNNLAVNIDEAKYVDISFYKMGGYSVKTNFVYENDTPNAYKGDMTKAGGSSFIIATDKEFDFIKDFKLNNYDALGGKFQCNGKDIDVASDGSVKIYNKSGVLVDLGEIGKSTPLEFKFIPNSDSYSNEKIIVDFSGTLYSKKSGEEKILANKTAEIKVDAVAQKPEETGFGLKDDDSPYINDPIELSDGNRSFEIPIKADFVDIDGSTQHYVLIEVVPGLRLSYSGSPLKTIKHTVGGEEKTFYQYPVKLSDLDIDNHTGAYKGKITLTIEPDSFIGNSGNVRFGFMSEETSKTDVKYNNNLAFNFDTDMKVSFSFSRDEGDLSVHPAYENNESTDPLAGKINWDAKVESVTGLKVTDGEGSLVIRKGGVDVPVSEHDVYSGSDLANMYFVSAINWKDTDAKFSYQPTYTGGLQQPPSTANVVVDAVANKPEAIAISESDINYGNGFVAAKPPGDDNTGGLVEIKVSAKFFDYDGSQDNYAIIEANDDLFTVENGEFVYLPDGSGDYGRFYKVKIDYTPGLNPDQSISTNIKIKLNKGVTDNFNVKTGFLAEENTLSDNEYTTNNNQSWTLMDETEVKVSTVKSKINFEFSPFVYEYDPSHEDSSPSEIKVKLVDFSLDPSDSLSGDLTLTYPGEGAFIKRWNDGNSEETHSDLNLSSSDLEAIKNGSLSVSFRPKEYSDESITFKWKAKIVDNDSGDEKNFNGNEQTIVDAVAGEAILSNTKASDESGAYMASKSEEPARIDTKISFGDTDGSETHYIVIEERGDTPCEKIIVRGTGFEQGITFEVSALDTIQTKNGQNYYCIEINKDTFQSVFGVPYSEYDGKFNVEYYIQMPEATKDQNFKIKVGGISKESNAGTEENPEIDLKNNWNESGISNVELWQGVVDATAIRLNPEGELKEGNRDILLNLIKLYSTDSGDPSEVITGAELKFNFIQTAEGPLPEIIGTLYYNSEKVADIYKDCEINITFPEGGYDPAVGLKFELSEGAILTGELQITGKYNLVDTKSGATKELSSEIAKVEIIAPKPVEEEDETGVEDLSFLPAMALLESEAREDIDKASDLQESTGYNDFLYLDAENEELSSINKMIFGGDEHLNPLDDLDVSRSFNTEISLENIDIYSPLNEINTENALTVDEAEDLSFIAPMDNIDELEAIIHQDSKSEKDLVYMATDDSQGEASPENKPLDKNHQEILFTHEEETLSTIFDPDLLHEADQLNELLERKLEEFKAGELDDTEKSASMNLNEPSSTLSAEELLASMHIENIDQNYHNKDLDIYSPKDPNLGLDESAELTNALIKADTGGS